MRWIRALGATVALLAMIVGVPALLVATVGNPWPDEGLDFMAPLTDNAVIGVIAVLTWIFWAQVMVCIVAEVVSVVRDVDVDVPVAFGLQRQMARTLVNAVVVGVIGLTATAGTTVSASAQEAPSPLSSETSWVDEGPDAEAGEQDAAVVDEIAGTGQEAAAQGQPTVTLQQGESLMGLAETHLGDADRWQEIGELNEGETMNDGRTFRAADRLRAGWVLQLPADATVEQAAAATGEAPKAEEDAGEAPKAKEGAGEATTTRTVDAGDHRGLWGIAEEEYDDGSAYQKIWDANAGKTMPSGRVFDDPDLIHPGDELEIPGPADAHEQPRERQEVPEAPSSGDESQAAPDVGGEGAAGEGDKSEGAGSQGGGPEVEEEAPRAAEASPVAYASEGATVEDVDEEAFPVRTVAGVGALLAAGVVALVGTKRRRQEQKRKPGQLVPAAAGGAAELEHDLRAVADPMSRETVDRALRLLAVGCKREGRALPVLRAARMTTEAFELYLKEPEPAVAPFVATSEPRMWALDQSLLEDASFDGQGAPFPGLVIIGHDEEDGHVLIDLEQVGELDLQADEDAAGEILAALAIEIATSCWADDVQVSVVGGLAELERMQTGRVRHVEHLSMVIGELEGRAANDRAALSDGTVQDARLDEHAGNWSPEVVLVVGESEEEDLRRLQALVQQLPRVSVAAVTTATGAGEQAWTLNVEPGGGRAVLDPFGLQLRPQRITEQDWESLLELLGTADAEPVGEPLADAEPAWMDLPEEAVEVAVADEEDEQGTAEELATSAAHDTAAVDDQVDEDIHEEETVEDDDVVVAFRGRAPHVKVLGPVTVVGAQGVELADSQIGRSTELVAYLALKPGGDYVALDKAISPNKRVTDNARNTRVGKVRRWLGTTSGGEPFVPRHPGAEGYRLHPDVTCDWVTWQELLANGVRAAGTGQLEQALDLVEGEPFANAKPKFYAWADELRGEMTRKIADAASELARRRLLSGAWDAAVQATEVGLTVAPENEALRRLQITAHAKAGRWAEVDRLTQRLLDVLDSLETEMSDETATLLAELEDRRAAAEAAGNEL